MGFTSVFFQLLFVDTFLKSIFSLRNFKNAIYLVKNLGLRPKVKIIFKTKRAHPDYLILSEV